MSTVAEQCDVSRKVEALSLMKMRNLRSIFPHQIGRRVSMRRIDHGGSHSVLFAPLPTPTQATLAESSTLSASFSVTPTL
jgi:hypothetical protein